MSEHDHAREQLDARTRKTASSPSGRPGLALHRAAGNSAVASLIAGAQAKLVVGDVADPQEREADEVAADVVRAIRSGSLAGGGELPTPPRLQRQATGAAGAQGGSVDAATERAISGSTGSQLPGLVRRTMEHAFGGVDFSGVRVHTGPEAAELNSRVGARAFTAGSDIFFRDGVPAVSDPLLAHELTHVVQQGAAPVPQLGGAGTIRRSAPRIVQRKELKALVELPVYKELENRKAHKGPYEIGGKRYRAKDSLSPGTPVSVVDGDWNAPRKGSLKPGFRGEPEVDFVGIKGRLGGVKGYVERRLLDPGSPSLKELKEERKKGAKSGGQKALQVGEKVGDLYGSPGIGDLASDMLARNDDGTLHEDAQKVRDQFGGASEQSAKNLAYASEAGDMAAGLMDLASAIMTLKDSEASVLDKVEAGRNIVHSTGSVVGGAVNIAAKATETKVGNETVSFGKTAEAAGGLAFFTGIFSTIKSTFDSVKSIIELVKSKKRDEKAKTVHGEFKTGMAAATSALEAVKSGLETVAGFLDTFSTGAGALTQTIPGFSIALGAADLIVRGVDLVIAIIDSRRMRKDKREFKQQILHPGDTSRTRTPKGSWKVRSPSAKKEAMQTIDELDLILETRDLDDKEQKAYDLASDYLLSRGVQYVNDKRRDRAILKMSVTMGKVAGDVATLGGASAPVGVGLKVGATLLDVGASGLRTFKQWGRDKKAALEAKQGSTITSGFWSIFNSGKSTDEKMRLYHRHVDRLFSMVVAASNLPGQQGLAAYDRITRTIEALGVPPRKLLALRNDPAKLRKELITAMKKRE